MDWGEGKGCWERKVMEKFTKKEENYCGEVGLIVVVLTWNFVFISMNGNAILSKIANTSPDYWTHRIGIMLLDRQFSNYL